MYCTRRQSQNTTELIQSALFITQMQVTSIFGFFLTIFLAPYYIALRKLAKIKCIQTFMCAREPLNLVTLIGQCLHTEPLIVPSAHFAGFLVFCHRRVTYGLKRPKTLKYGIIFYDTSHFYKPLNLAGFMPSAHFVSWFLCRHRGMC